MLVPKTVRSVNSVELARAAGMGRNSRTLAIPNIPRPTLLSQQLSGCHCSGGLGFVDLSTGTNQGNYSILGAVSAGSNMIPVIGPIASSVTSLLSGALSAFSSWLGIGKGRAEADIIVPYANELMSRLDAVTNQILLGRNPSVSQLQSLYSEVWQLALGYMEYVALPDFTDRRASGQALNTMMPYIDGTCGYPEPLPLRVPYPSQTNCLSWGDGTVGGMGTNGMLGALARAIAAQGGDVPVLGSIIDSANDGIRTSGAGVPFPGIPADGGGDSTYPGYPGVILTSGPSTLLPVAIGLGALFMFARKRRM